MDTQNNRIISSGERASGINELKLEIRKHHVTPGVKVFDLVMDIDGERIKSQTQHQDGDPAFQKFAREFTKLAKALSEENTFLGIPSKQ